MFFDDRGAEYHAGDGGGVVQGMVGQAGDQAEALHHVGDGAQVVVLGGGRVAADAVQDGQLLAAAFAGGVDGLLDFLGIGHAGGDDHRLAGAGHVLDQRQVDGFKGSDLVGGGVEVFQQVDGGVVER
ncbi:hypothetical protein D3C78_1563530 [compost metagenome]